MGTLVSTIASASGIGTGLYWWLKDPANPAAAVRLSSTPGNFEAQATDRQQIVTIVGRPDPVALNDIFQLPVLSALNFVFITQEDYIAFEALRATQRIFLLQGPKPVGQWYVRLGATKTDETNLASVRGWATNGQVIRSVNITATAMGTPS